MVFFKNIELRVIEDKYGSIQRGMFALEAIKKGEKVWYCECSAKDEAYTRAQLLDKIKKQPHLDYFLRSFSYMIDHDLYGLPVTFMEQKNNDECAYFNHSCTPNVGYSDEFDTIGDKIVACADIEPGDELLIHYGFLESEASLIYDLECKCSASNCCGRMKFNYYRDPEFVARYYPFMTSYLKKKVDDMAEKWHSEKTYIRRYKPLTTSSSSSSSKKNKPITESVAIVAAGRSSECCTPMSMTPATNIDSSSSGSSSESENENDSGFEGLNESDEFELGLCTLFDVRKDEQVAEFKSLDDLLQRNHFLRHSEDPNCYIIDTKVFAKYDVPSETELTIYYHGILL